MFTESNTIFRGILCSVIVIFSYFLDVRMDQGHCSQKSLPTTTSSSQRISQTIALCYPGIQIARLSSEGFDFVSMQP